MKVFDVVAVSSLAKIFAVKGPCDHDIIESIICSNNETTSYQIGYKQRSKEVSKFYKIKIDSKLANIIDIRQVTNVPVSFPAHDEVDENYIDTKPGLYPDLLKPLDDNTIYALVNQWQSLWIDVNVDSEIEAGNYSITIEFYDYKTSLKFDEISIVLKVLDFKLPKQKLIHTEWFHSDCLAQYYDVPIFSKDHFIIIDKFIKTTVKRGCNMILTPHLTPPLDTAIGFNRMTTQLVEITVDSGNYHFNFDKLRTWVKICLDNGIEYFEMSHLFTQWGAKCAPKVMATVDGNYKQIFGWDTQANNKQYINFLQIYLKQLSTFLKDLGINNNVYFHISDEPYINDLENYKVAKSIVSEYLDDYKMLDAISDFKFYESGLIDNPVCANNHIEPFIDNKVENLWTYYCTSQKVDVSNRFISMPSTRNRILGYQLFKYDIKGFLHWGYNFYNSFESLFQINPYTDTCSGGVFPGGDPFLVYPGKYGEPEESIRIMVLYHALNDLRAYELLASYIGKTDVIKLVENNLNQPITFKSYPTNISWYEMTRKRVYDELNKYCNM